MNRILKYRFAGCVLAFAVLALGIASIVLLYLAGETSIDFLYENNFVYDSHGRITVRMPQDDVYGSAMMKAWAVGFIYILVAISATIASLFCKSFLVIIHLVITVLVLVVGSFIHTSGGMGLLVYRLIVGQGITRTDFFLPTCVYMLPNGDLTEDQKCLKGRHALNLTIAALVMLGLTWIVSLLDLLFHAMTYNFVSLLRTYKKIKESPTRQQTSTIPGPSNTQHQIIAASSAGQQHLGMTTQQARPVPSTSAVIGSPEPQTDTSPYNKTVQEVSNTEPQQQYVGLDVTAEEPFHVTSRELDSNVLKKAVDPVNDSSETSEQVTVLQGSPTVTKQRETSEQQVNIPRDSKPSIPVSASEPQEHPDFIPPISNIDCATQVTPVAMKMPEEEDVTLDHGPDVVTNDNENVNLVRDDELLPADLERGSLEMRSYTNPAYL